jgi:hypothetical protein
MKERGKCVGSPSGCKIVRKPDLPSRRFAPLLAGFMDAKRAKISHEFKSFARNA